MKFLFVHSHKFKYAKNGNVYSEGQFPYELIKERYLPFCDELTIAGRCENISSVDNLSISSGPKVKHHILPNLSTVKNRFKLIKELKFKLRELIKKSDILIARMPSTHARYAIEIAKELNKPYVVEVVGDVLISLWTHGSIFGKLLAPISYVRAKKSIGQAPYVIYVTKEYLQKRYPHKRNALTIHASNVELKQTEETVLLNRIKRIHDNKNKNEYLIGLIGSYSSRYKGIDTAIKSIKKLKDRGINCKLLVLGSGNNEWLINLAKSLEVDQNIEFIGVLPGGDPVLKWLDTLDIYIQPSLTEGLPRALIEAMSRALPCIGSSVGGIPELLEKDCIHTPKSEKDLTLKIEPFLSDPKKLVKLAKRNFNVSKEYTSQVLNTRREEFWSQVFKKEF